MASTIFIEKKIVFKIYIKFNCKIYIKFNCIFESDEKSFCLSYAILIYCKSKCFCVREPFATNNGCVVDAALAVAEGSERVNCDYVPSHTNASMCMRRNRGRGGRQHRLGVSNLIDLEFNTYGQIATNTFRRPSGGMGERSLPFRSNAPITVADNQKCLTKDVNQFGYDCDSVSREDCGRDEKIVSLYLSNEF